MGVTLSEEQVAKTKERIKKENLEDLVDVKLQDYRELADSNVQFDRLVTVGMVEHVGEQIYRILWAQLILCLKMVVYFYYILLQSKEKLSQIPGWKSIFSQGDMYRQYVI